MGLNSPGINMKVQLSCIHQKLIVLAIYLPPRYCLLLRTYLHRICSSFSSCSRSLTGRRWELKEKEKEKVEGRRWKMSDQESEENVTGRGKFVLVHAIQRPVMFLSDCVTLLVGL